MAAPGATSSTRTDLCGKVSSEARENARLNQSYMRRRRGLEVCAGGGDACGIGLGPGCASGRNRADSGPQSAAMNGWSEEASAVTRPGREDQRRRARAFCLSFQVEVCPVANFDPRLDLQQTVTQTRPQLGQMQMFLAFSEKLDGYECKINGAVLWQRHRQVRPINEGFCDQ